LDYIKSYVLDEREDNYWFNTYDEAIVKREQYINNMFASFPDSISNCGKN
jgi:hypothetical protein